MKTGFIGCGNMAKAIISGILKSGFAGNEDVLVYDISPEARAYAENELMLDVRDGNISVALDSDILVLDSPTRGIDVKVKQAIYALMADLKNQGRSIIMISEEIPELLGMADRILIMKDGKINGEFPRDPALNEEDLIAKMV